jgi:DivIVA domain-containing protein
MAEIDTGAVRSQRFSVVRKGYDRAEVDAYLAELAGHVEALDDRIVALEGQFEQLGIEEPKDLAAELEAVGDEVAAVLREAQAAAAAMRLRASEDAARWRSEADEEVRRRRAETDEQVEALRASALE